MTFLILARRTISLLLGLALTAYSAHAAWVHNHGDLLGPLVAISAAVLLALAEVTWQDRQLFRSAAFLVLGLVAAGISASVVLDRVASTEAGKIHSAKSSNVPRQQAQARLADEEEALKTANAAAKAECANGRGRKCAEAETRADKARDRVADARGKLSDVGAEQQVNPAGLTIATVFGISAETYSLTMPLLPGLFIELAAPLLLAYSISPVRHRPARAPAPAEPAPRPVKLAEDKHRQISSAGGKATARKRKLLRAP